MTDEIVNTEVQQNQDREKRSPVVFIKDGNVFTSSRDVAEFFDKELKHVHEAIRNMIAKEPDVGSNFRPFKIKDLTGESVSHYEMSRDGFALLVMGFTGTKALQWKLRYIEAFNAMEAQLRNTGGYQIPQTHAAALRLAADLSEQVEKQKLELASAHQEIAGLLPSAEALKRIEESTGDFCATDAAKLLQMQPKKLISWMEVNGWFYRRPGSKDCIAYQSRIQSGYLTMKSHTVRTATGDLTVHRVRITTKGLVKLGREFGVTIDPDKLSPPAQLFPQS